MKEGFVCEVFSSVQGEGILVGLRQAFIRFSECNLDCRYCDTPQAKVRPREFNVRGEVIRVHANPVSPQALVGVLSYLPAARHSISITGGEPLLQGEFLSQFFPALKEEGETIYLETNGTLPDALESVIRWVDWVAMDIKLQSATGNPAAFDVNRRFLQIARQKEVFVKLVVVNETTDEELQEAGRLIAGVSPEIPAVLQPVNPMRGALPPDGNRLIRMADVLGKKLKQVRVIPQIHPILGFK